MLLLGLTLMRLPIIRLRMETLANTFANDSTTARAKCVEAFLASRVSSGDQHLSPYLEDHLELRELDFVDPYP